MHNMMSRTVNDGGMNRMGYDSQDTAVVGGPMSTNNFRNQQGL